jgi:hemoglobin-like flavoprotein
MNTEQFKLVQDSLIQVRPIADQVAESFYARLFMISPHLRKLFMGDMKRQGTMLMTSLELAVSGLDNMESILPAVQALGERHVSYGVKAEYYPLATDAFLWALGYHLGDDFTPALRDAWAKAFDALVGAMLSAG